MNRWITALPFLAVSVSISGGGATRAGSDAAAEALSPAQVSPKVSAQQKHGVHRLHRRPSLARRSKLPAPDPLTAFAKTRPPALASTPTVTTAEEEEVLRPHRVATVSVMAHPAPADTPEAIMAPPPDEGKNKPPLWPALQRSSDPAMPTDLMILLSTCAGAAMGVYGLVAFNPRRRAARDWRRGFSELSPLSDRNSKRGPRQRLFPHQIGLLFPVEEYRFENRGAVTREEDALRC
jgi:hypothetical protein